MLRHHWPGAAPARWQGRDPVDGRGAHVVLCLAGVTPQYAQIHGADLEDNVTLGRRAVEDAARIGARRVLLASSAAVYGNRGGLLGEQDSCRPVSDYGRIKLEMETQCARLGETLGVCVTSLRIGNVAGADAILAGWRKGMRIDTLEDGTTPRRSYVGPRGFARIMADVVSAASLPPVINLALSGTVQMGALLDAAGLEWTGRPAPAQVIPRVELETSLLRAVSPAARHACSAQGIADEYLAYVGRGAQ